MEYSIKPKRFGRKENNPLPSKEDNWIIRNIGHKSIALKERQQGCSAEVIAYADKANERLRRRFYRMTLNKGINRNVATTAIARELACFMWGMATGNIS